MQPSQFNLRVPLDARNEVFLMNTLTDAQLLVSPDVAALLDRALSGDAKIDWRPADKELPAPPRRPISTATVTAIESVD